MLVAERVLLAPGVDLGEPPAAVGLELSDVRLHRRERLLRVGDELDVRAHVLAHLRAVDVDVDEGLDVGRELGELGGHPVVDTHPDHHQNVGALHRFEAPACAHEPGHVQGQRVLDRKRADAEQRGADRGRRGLGQFLELSLGVAEDHAVSGQDHRPLRV